MKSPVATFAWCNDAALEELLSQMYLDNVSADYISHSELQGPRADAPGRWRSDLADTIRAEVRAALSPDEPHALLATATVDNNIVGLAMVSLDTRRKASRAFAALDDIVLLPQLRGGGTGGQLVEWIAGQLRERGIARLFLECGINNLPAQGFFKSKGFQPVSVVMLRELSDPA
ncbi:GNAT family N-acetyltransferase [Janthinobacterium agaricidamnosum]|nr:GNAT family N-acetyltransferase [Janthinobacterium agaricidamnosum]